MVTPHSPASDHIEDENSWNSPPDPTAFHEQTPLATTKPSHTARPTYLEQQARTESLQQELQNVRKVNEAIEGVVRSLDKAQNHMKVCT